MRNIRIKPKLISAERLQNEKATKNESSISATSKPIEITSVDSKHVPVQTFCKYFYLFLL